jgi:ubiquinone/menaquinone biosynthesis C-methylase UbiE/catechol 2,3-dioxygenase-like lactoylglutathione lyase family enzyme
MRNGWNYSVANRTLVVAGNVTTKQHETTGRGAMMQAHEAMIEGFDHVQVTAPRTEEARMRAFYGETLGLREIPKPEVLAKRGGAWYACAGAQLHLGLEDQFQPARKAHPAFRVADLAAVRARLEAAGAPITVDLQLPGCVRFETRDPAGNRLEFIERLADTAGADQLRDERAATIKKRVRETFGRAAAAYISSPTHAAGDDLARLVELAQPAETDLALDISTGGGHTALALAPHVARVIASDLTPRMLDAARDFISAQGVTNVEYVVADAEGLPFLDETFDLVTVRIAPHHYADVRAAVREMRRVLKRHGRLVVVDNIAPEDPTLDTLANEWEKRRDPSHVREYTAVQWRAFIAEAGLIQEQLESRSKSHAFQAWVERTGMPAADRDALEADMLTAPREARDHFSFEVRGGRLMSWSAKYVVLKAVKSA